MAHHRVYCKWVHVYSIKRTVCRIYFKKCGSTVKRVCDPYRCHHFDRKVPNDLSDTLSRTSARDNCEEGAKMSCIQGLLAFISIALPKCRKFNYDEIVEILLYDTPNTLCAYNILYIFPSPSISKITLKLFMTTAGINSPINTFAVKIIVHMLANMLNWASVVSLYK